MHEPSDDPARDCLDDALELLAEGGPGLADADSVSLNVIAHALTSIAASQVRTGEPSPPAREAGNTLTVTLECGRCGGPVTGTVRVQVTPYARDKSSRIALAGAPPHVCPSR